MSFNIKKPWLKNRNDYYRTEKVNFHGKSFDSKGEAGLYNYLLMLEKDNQIQELICKPQILIGPEGALRKERQLMIPDFSAFCLKEQKVIFHEFKGFEDEKWRYKKKMWLWHGPGVMVIYKGSAKNFKVVEEITPLGLR